MNNLEIVIEKLKNTSDKETQIKILQEINIIEPIADNVRKILGSNSNSILEKLKSEN